MKIKCSMILILIALLRIENVISQTTPGPDPSSIEAIPPLLRAAMLHLKADILTMKSLQKIDGPKLVADIESILDAGKTSGIVLPNEVQNQVQELIKKIQQVTGTASADPNEVEKLVKGVKRQIMSFIRNRE